MYEYMYRKCITPFYKSTLFAQMLFPKHSNPIKSHVKLAHEERGHSCCKRTVEEGASAEPSLPFTEEIV